ncbi:undecaprenyl-phosphate glucose phosphotransferase [Alcaligenaceae bacterium C4P045]|nr:undecaprenyl-phosphate glucose phosphotransferase [Alcaligenaceae bacterium C4P045]
MNSPLNDASHRPPGRGYPYRALDAAVVLCTGILSARWQFDQNVPPLHYFLAYLCSMATFALFPAFGLYASWRGRRLGEWAARSLLAWICIFTLGIFIAFLIHQVATLSRLATGIWFVSAAATLVGMRIAAFFLMRAARDRGMDQKRVLIIGFGPLGHDLWRRVDRYRGAGYEVAGIFAQEHERLPAGVLRVESLEDLPTIVNEQAVREIWIALPMEASPRVREVLHHLRHDLVEIRWIPDVMSVELLGHRVGDFLGMPTIHLNSLPASGIRGMAKEVFDRTFAACVLLFLAPLLLGIAAAIKFTSRGPVFFRQPRLGVDGQVFNVFKFRTMTVHSEHGQVTQATRDDVRVTKLGAFLRRTSLDELPQFLNVLRGEMSVVGPRPHALAHNEQYKEIVARYMMRHRVKPGITGWAQINGLRGQTDTLRKMSDRVEFDIYYIQNWTFLMDMHIIMRTAFSGWTGKNVY